MWRPVSYAAAATFALLGGSTAEVLAAGQGQNQFQPTVIRGASASEVVVPDRFDGDLRDLPKAKAWRRGDPVREIPRQVYPRPQKNGKAPRPGSPRIDPLLEIQERAPQDQQSRDFTVPDLNLEGFLFTGVWPPDTVGDIGPDHYIHMVNSGDGALFVVSSKTGVTLAGPTYLDSLFAGGNCASGRGDPIVLYDRMADRWLMSEFVNPAVTNALCVYISQTPNPVTGGWFRYEFTTPNFPDYPKYAVWPDAYYVSTNESTGPAVYALDRSKMLAGAAANSQRFTVPRLAGFPFQALIPADLDGANTPPAGSPGYFMRHRDDEVHNPGSNNPAADFLEVWEFEVDFTTPTNSTFTGPLNIPVSEFDSDLCPSHPFDCFPQPGTGVLLDPIREVVMWRLQYRNFGSHETLVGNLVTDVDQTDHGGIRWFELRKAGAGAWDLFQEGTYAPDAAHRWMGGIAMDGNGNMALGYSVSSTSIHPSIRYTGRLAGDTAGVMSQPETTIIAGSGSQTSTRWGDYSAMSVDPSDGCTFVYTNEYLPADGFWRTRIATFRFPTCDNTPAVPSDFNANVSSDILWRNTVTGGAVIWLMIGFDKDDSGSIGGADTDWQVMGSGDFDGDRKADVLWRNTVTGGTVIWLMNGLVKDDSGSVGRPSTDWQVAGIGDFDGDRKSDILWRNSTTGSALVWLMNGLVKGDSRPIGNPGVGWQVAGVGDFNKDTKSDILWRNSTTGAPVVWQMNGFVKEASGSIGNPGADWQVKRLGDFNGDRRSDILWRNSTTASPVVWLMNGFVKEAAGSIGNPGADWQIQGTGDHDGDVKADILWRNTGTGNAVIWKMNGLSKDSAGSIGNPGADWQVQ